ncbi:hypothetical protein JRC04_16695 [Mycolicibacterium sp. S2-37]|nr:hypothetical protein [Mycolicibacterium sp. S2-37]
MIGSPASGGQVFDQYALDLPDGGMTDLAETIVGTYREVAESGNRVAAIRLCLPDASEAETLRQTVLSAGVQNVALVAETEAAAAVARSVGADAALLLAGDDTVSLTTVGEDQESTSVLASLPIGAAGAAVASASVLQSLPSGETVRIALVGQRLDLDSIAAELGSTTTPVVLPPDAGYAVARGAAQTAFGTGFPAGASTMMAPVVVDATQMAPAVDVTQMAPVADATQMAPLTDQAAAVGPQLAYSQEEPAEYELPFDSLEEFVPELEDEQAYTAMIAPPPPKALLMGSAFAFVVAALATLAVSVAVTIRPAADVAAQPAPAVQPQTVPGRFLPEVPHAPDPVALPISVVSPAPAAPGVRLPVNRGPNPVVPPPVQVPVPAPAPGAPVVPVPAVPPPVPGVPVPVVPTVPFPPFNPFPTLPTFTTTVTTSVTPTTTPSTPTTTVTTPTTPTTTATTPTTTIPTTTATTPPPTTTATVEPTTPTQTSTVPPAPTTVPTVTPEPEVPVTQEPAYTPPAEPAYTPPAEPAYTPPAPAPEPAAPVAPEPVVPEVPSSGGEGGYEVPVTTFPLSP